MMLSITALKAMPTTSRQRFIALTGEPAVLADDVMRTLLSIWKLPIIDLEDPREAQIDTLVPVVLRIDPADKIDPKVLNGLRDAAPDSRILVVMRTTSKKVKGFEPDIVIECGPLQPTGPRFEAYVQHCCDRAGLRYEPSGIDACRMKLGQAQGRIAVEVAKVKVRHDVLTAETAGLIDTAAIADADPLVDAVLQGDRRTALLLATTWLDRTDVLTAAISMLSSRLRLAKAWALAQDRRQSKRDFATLHKLPAFRLSQIEAAVPAARQRFERIVSGLVIVEQTVRTRSDAAIRFDAVVRGVLEMT